MSILTMKGPAFLLLYAVIALLVWLLVSRLIARREENLAGPLPLQLKDPYAIAFLRGDTPALLRVVCMALSRRGLLEIDTRLRALVPTGGNRMLVPIEAAVLNACGEPIPAAQLGRAPAVRVCVQRYKDELEAQHLLVNPEIRALRWFPCLLAAGALVALAGAKISVALASGHSNVGFLVILTFLTVLFFLAKIFNRRTQPGREMLSHLSELFSHLKSRRTEFARGGALSEVALLAAVFGVFAWTGDEKAAWARAWGTANSDGSSCGSGGGGGGDGGGGGCGGCGGCGGG